MNIELFNRGIVVLDTYLKIQSNANWKKHSDRSLRYFAAIDNPRLLAFSFQLNQNAT